MKKILVVDDDLTFLSSVEEMLKDEGFIVQAESNPISVAEKLNDLKFDAALFDVKMPGLNGMDLMHRVNAAKISAPIIFISGQSDISIAVEAIKIGAFDFIEKPVDPERLLITLNNALVKNSLTVQNANIFSELEENYRMIGESEQLSKLISIVDQVAPTNARVLIQGESGTGKELVAWAIHHHSLRKEMPYLKLNCAAIPSELLESQLFGHKKGSFTGADSDRIGKFMAANEGTLFLDEIGDMSFELQSKLLRVLEENEIEIIGENFPQKVDVRIIAATNKNLKEMINDGLFRSDLYYRLNVVEINLTPLRERISDVLPLAYHFSRKFSEDYNKKISGYTNHAEQLLINHVYPGNVRELKNIIEKIVIYSQSELIDADLVYKIFESSESNEFENSYEKLLGKKMYEARESFERDFIINTLKANNWEMTSTANSLGIERSYLYRKMHNLGISKE